MAEESLSPVVQLTRWLHGIGYADIRRAETLLTVPITVGKEKKQLRGVLVAPDLCLGRDRQFYKIIDDHAIKIPLYLVCEQYDLETLMKKYHDERKSQPRSR